MISPPRVRHRRKEAAVLAAVIVTVVAVVGWLTFVLVYWLA